MNENLTVQCIGYREDRRKSMLGYAKFFVKEWGVTVAEMPVFEGEKGIWVGLPSKKVWFPDGSSDYVDILEFQGNEKYDFTKPCVVAVKAFWESLKEPAPAFPTVAEIPVHEVHPHPPGGVHEIEIGIEPPPSTTAGNQRYTRPPGTSMLDNEEIPF